MTFRILSSEEEMRKQLQAIHEAIDEYHYSLDSLQPTGIAPTEAVRRIEEIIGAPWIEGAAKWRREKAS